MNSNIVTLTRERRAVSQEIDQLLELETLNNEQESRYNELVEKDESILHELYETRNRSETLPIRPDVNADGRGYGFADGCDSRISPITLKPGNAYRSLFPNVAMSNGGFRDMREYLQTVGSRRFDPRLETRASQNLGTGSAGGFLVPSEYSNLLLDLVLQESFMLPKAQVIPMTGDTLDAPLFEDSDHSASRAGVTARWGSEEGSLTEDSFNFSGVSFKAAKLFLFLPVSNEWLSDTRDGANMIMRAGAKEMAWSLDKAFLTGSGVGRPLGMFDSSGKITVAGTTGQSANTFIFDNATDMDAKIDERSGEAFWLVNQSVKPQLYEMALTVGTGGNTVYSPVNISGKDRSLLGHSIVYSEHCSALGTEKDVVLLCPKQYVVALRSDLRVDVSEHYFFSTDKTVFRFIIRCDARPVHKSSLTLANGGTVADVVTLNSSKT